MAEIVIYYHLYNKKFGSLDISPEQVRVLKPVVPSVEAASVNDSPVPFVPELKLEPLTVEALPQKKTSNVFLRLSKFSALVGIALILFFYAPKALAWSESVVSSTIENFRMSDTEVQTLKSDLNTSKPIIEPPFDPRLPVTNHLLIPAIGVTTDVQEATADNYEAALRKGVWRVSDFGAPNDNGEPIILAAHRFGYLAWTDSYRHKNSFYNLPKVNTGDLIEIDWNQRKYLYEVYAVGKGKEILDYSADLILYTCETLTGENKIFVYARLIQT
ncbi:MAG: sortase [Candidatus Woesebacteria bacterium]|nr:sortase [Candidatus Woesebacteria bacterium]